MVKAAIASGLSDLGFSSHAPLPFQTSWNMRLSDLDRYRDEIDLLREEYAGRIRLWLGLELDYIPDPRVELFQRQHIFGRRFDYFVGSVHFLGSSYPPLSFDGSADQFDHILQTEYGGEIREMCRDFYARVARVPQLPYVRIIAHLDLIKRWNAEAGYFREQEGWYRDLVTEAVGKLAMKAVVIELNTAGWRKGLGEQYPSGWILKVCRDQGVPVTLSADAHQPGQLTWGYERAEELLRQLDIIPQRPLPAMIE